MSAHRRSARLMAVFVCGVALAALHPAAAQPADQPAAESVGGADEIVVAARPNGVASVELVKGPETTLSGPAPGGGAAVAKPNEPSGLEGYIEGGFGSYGRHTLGGGVTVPLAAGKGELRIEGYEAHTGVR